MMNKVQMRREKLYQITMSMVKKMLADGLISKEEFDKIMEKNKDSFSPLLARI